MESLEQVGQKVFEERLWRFSPNVSGIGFAVLFCFYFRKNNCSVNDAIVSFGSHIEKSERETYPIAMIVKWCQNVKTI